MMPTKKRLTLADLDKVVLRSGAHDRRTLETLCVMEAVAWVAGREHTDRPPCVSPVIGAFLRSWNDAMNDVDRQMLKPLIPKFVGTAATPELELRRSWMALDWYCRVSAPAWLRLAGLTAEAEAIESTAPIVDSASAQAAQQALNTACDAAYKAWDAAWAAGAAAGAAAWAAGAAAGAATWAARAARAAGDAGAAAGAAGAAAGAAWAAWAAWAAGAAGAKLRPTVEHLQASALTLIERMAALSATGEIRP